jgi:outer membrane receptor protein involved in Fe transport
VITSIIVHSEPAAYMRLCVRSLRTALFAVTGFLAIPAAAHAADTPRDTLTGVVTDTAAQPIEAAMVTIAELQRSVTSGKDGRFLFPDVAPGRYTVIVARIGFATMSLQATVPQASPLAFTMHVSPLRLAPVTVTAARMPSLALHSPLPVSDVGPERLQRDESVSLGHALDGLAGVRDITTGQQVGAPVVRGLSGPSVLVLDGGLRLEDYSWSTEDGPSVDPRLANSVEVIRGPMSVIYGSNAIGGVINVLPAPVPDALGGGSFTHIGGEIYGATNNSEVGGIVKAEGAQNAFGWQATLIGRTAGNFHTPTGNPETPTGDIYDTGYDAINGDVAIGLKGEDASGTLRFSHYGGNFGLLDGPPVPDDNTSGPLRKLQDDRTQLTGSFNLSSTARLEAKAQWQSHSLQEVVGDSRVGNDPPEIDLRLTTWTADVFLHHIQGDWLTGTVGVSGMYQTNGTFGQDPLVPAANTWNAAAYAFEQANKGQWSFLVGVRGDLGQIEASNNADLGVTAQTRDANAFTADAGVVYRPIDHMAMSFNVGRAYRAPTLIELFSNGPLPAEGIYVTGLQTAVPEVSLDFDASLRWETPKLQAGISFYHNSVDNYLYLQATGDSTAVPNDAGGFDTLANYQYMQTSHATLQGVDLSAEWAALPMWTLRGRYDIVRGTNDATGEPLSLMPPPRLDLGVEWHTVRGTPAYVQLGTHIFSEQTRLGPFDTPTAGYTLWELGGGVGFATWGRSLQLDVRVTNLFDKTYTDFLSRYKTFAYGPGRNIIFRLSLPY